MVCVAPVFACAGSSFPESPDRRSRVTATDLPLQPHPACYAGLDPAALIIIFR